MAPSLQREQQTLSFPGVMSLQVLQYTKYWAWCGEADAKKNKQQSKPDQDKTWPIHVNSYTAINLKLSTSNFRFGPENI